MIYNEPPTISEDGLQRTSPAGFPALLLEGAQHHCVTAVSITKHVLQIYCCQNCRTHLADLLLSVSPNTSCRFIAVSTVKHILQIYCCQYCQTRLADLLLSVLSNTSCRFTAVRTVKYVLQMYCCQYHQTSNIQNNYCMTSTPYTRHSMTSSSEVNTNTYRTYRPLSPTASSPKVTTNTCSTC